MASELSPLSPSPSTSLSTNDEGTERSLSSSTTTTTPSIPYSPVIEDMWPQLHHRAFHNTEGIHRSGNGNPMQGFFRQDSRPVRLLRSNSLERVGQAAAETYLITGLAIILLRYFGVGYRWITKLIALLCYVILVFPGIIQVGYYYFFSRRVRRSIVYAGQPRNRLDLYLPCKVDTPRPIVIFVTGGAWIIGYKAWGSLLGRRLAKRGIIVACLDYRNFPQGTIHHMVEDVSRGVSFMCNAAQKYGGDPNRIYLIGQSAGAHIAACAIVNQAIKEYGGENTFWSLFQIRAYFGISGGYNLTELVDHFHGRGLYRSIFLSIMEGEKSLHRFSPELLVKDPSLKRAISLLPPIILYHGTSDQSIPVTASKKFFESLHSVGAKAKFISFEGKSHTDLFIQDPLRGLDETMEHIVAAIYADDEAELAKVAAAPRPPRLVPEFMLKLAHEISPF